MPKTQLINSAVFILLQMNVLSNNRLVYANRRYKVVSGPEMLSREVPPASQAVPGYVGRTLVLNFERFTEVRFYILFPELSNSACLPGIAGGLPKLITIQWPGESAREN